MNARNPSLAAGLMATLLFNAPAQAGDVYCPPNLGNVVVEGNVIVASACRLEGTIVRGNVHVYAGGSLVARDVRVEGSVQTERAVAVDIRTSRINGSIQLDDMVGSTSTVLDNFVGGSIQMKGNMGQLDVLGNDIGADIQAFENRGGVVLEENVVDGNLQCKSNLPAPVGGGNRVAGNKEDQCANLLPAGSPVASVAAPIAASSAATTSATAGSSGSGGGGGGSFEIPTVLGLLGLGLLGRRLRNGQARRSAR